MYNTTSLLFHRLDRGRGVRKEGWGNELIMSNAYNTTHLYHKSKDDIYMPLYRNLFSGVSQQQAFLFLVI
jgi:hypothetical protein